MDTLAALDHIEAEGLPPPGRGRGQWPRTLALISDVLDLSLKSAMPDDLKRMTAVRTAVVRLAATIGGKDVYLPTGSLDIAIRHAEIWRLSADCGWSDCRIADWAKMSERSVRRVIQHQRDMRINQRQLPLFMDTSPERAA